MYMICFYCLGSPEEADGMGVASWLLTLTGWPFWSTSKLISMPRLKRSVVRRTLLFPDSAEGVGDGGWVDGDWSERVGGGGVSDDDDDAIDDRLTTLLIRGSEGSTVSLSLSI